MVKQPEQEEQEQEALAHQMGDGYALSLNLVVSTLVGLGFGLMLDRWLGTVPLFLLLFMFLGFVAGLRKLILSAQRRLEEEE